MTVLAIYLLAYAGTGDYDYEDGPNVTCVKGEPPRTVSNRQCSSTYDLLLGFGITILILGFIGRLV